jgi:hypothetical protein
MCSSTSSFSEGVDLFLEIGEIGAMMVMVATGQARVTIEKYDRDSRHCAQVSAYNSLSLYVEARDAIQREAWIGRCGVPSLPHNLEVDIVSRVTEHGIFR